jgi:hypothetical protein
MINTVPGSNATVYDHSLSNLIPNKDYIVQMCTTNAVGRNCSSTFKIKTEKAPSKIMQRTLDFFSVLFCLLSFKRRLFNFFLTRLEILSKKSNLHTKPSIT